MLDRSQSEDIASRIFAMVGGKDEAELIVNSESIGSTRFAANAISQHQQEDTCCLRLRVLSNSRQGVAECNALDEPALRSLVARALHAAHHATPDPELQPLLAVQPKYTPSDPWIQDTLDMTPRQRVERIQEQVALCRQRQLEAAGLFATGASSLAYANSHGVRAFHRRTRASCSMSVFADDGRVEGYADDVDHNVNSLSLRRVGSTAMEKALQGRNPGDIEPGAWDVILEGAAFIDPLDFFISLGCTPLRHIEGRTGLVGKLGQKLFSEHLTIRSDPYDPRLEGVPFDYEGFPRQALSLVDRGVFQALPHDRRTAAKMQATNTGHAPKQPSAWGPAPSDIVVSEGKTALDEMIASTERGLLVTTIHYTNTVDPMELSITGMTRGGLWLIEKGKLVRPVKNMRFSDSLLRAFAAIDAVGNISEASSAGLFGGEACVPAVRIRGLRFTSGTDF